MEYKANNEMRERERIDQDETLNDVKEFFELNKTEIIREMSGENNVVHIDFDEFAAHSPELAETLIERPEEMIQLLEIGLEELEWAPNDARARFTGIAKGQELFIRNIRVKHLEKMVSIDGIIQQISEVQPLVKNVKFECLSCRKIISVLQIDRKNKEPSRCPCGQCSKFEKISEDVVEAQILTIEETSENLNYSGKIGKILIFLKEDLIDPNMNTRVTLGSKVKIIGTLKEIETSLGGGKVSTRLSFAIDANNIIPIDENLKFTKEDKIEILELAANPDLIEKITDSIAPSVWGKRDVKKALALQLFGGVKKHLLNETKRRGNIHILLVGDPGTAKSDILKFIVRMSPRAQYVSGKSTKGFGLVATVTNNEILKGLNIEAGAMIMANKSIACIDEIDSITDSNTPRIFEAMEHQMVTISKTTFKATLCPQTSVLAAANPRFGRFDSLRSIPGQINLDKRLLSRFDAIFIMRDISGRDNDSSIANHILSKHRQTAKHDVIDNDLLKKYISYAKQNHNPTLTEEAAKSIKDFYVGLRNIPQIGNGPTNMIPIQANKLESVIRFAEAHARMRLSNTVEIKDAAAAIELVKSYLMQVGHDNNTDTFDIDKIEGDSAKSRNNIHTVQDALESLRKRLGELIPLRELTKELDGKVSETEVNEAIGKLLKSGYLFRPKRGYVQRI